MGWVGSLVRMTWFGGSRRHRELSTEANYWIDAIGGCALHPKYLDFAAALHGFHSAVEMEFAAKDIAGLRRDFIEEQWALHLAGSEPGNVMLRAARVYTDRLIEVVES
jgi:hypothetical protein